MMDSTGTTTRVYDELNRVVSKIVPAIGTTTFSYDQTSGLPVGFNAEVSTDPKSNVVKKITDKAGRLYQVVDSNEVTTFEYYLNGNRKTVSYPGGASEEYTYYPSGQLHTLSNKQGSRIIEAYSYSYDEAGNMKKKVDGKGTTEYEYDSLNRLFAVNQLSTSIGTKTTYQYDASGNRKKETVIAGLKEAITYYNYNEQNRLTKTLKRTKEDSISYEKSVGGVIFDYDANGNMLSSMPYTIPGSSSTSGAGIQLFSIGEEDSPISDSSKELATYQYDTRNNMVKAIQGKNTVKNTYNGNGLRASKTINGKVSHYLYEYDKIILEVDSSKQEIARNVYGTNLLKRTAGGESFYYMYNGHGDVTSLLTSGGQTAAYTAPHCQDTKFLKTVKLLS